jgi:uncharacterized membrane protein required for colicin V production
MKLVAIIALAAAIMVGVFGLLSGAANVVGWVTGVFLAVFLSGGLGVAIKWTMMNTED